MAAGQQHLDYDALVKHDRVHGRVYTDTDIFDEEMAKIFHRGWVYVGHAGSAHIHFQQLPMTVVLAQQDVAHVSAHGLHQRVSLETSPLHILSASYPVAAKQAPRHQQNLQTCPA